MRRWIPLFGFLVLVLAAFPALAAPPTEEAPAAPEIEKTATVQNVVQPQEENTDLELLPGTVVEQLEVETATCDPLECFRDCRQGCPFGCQCSGSCATGDCECDEICGP